MLRLGIRCRPVARQSSTFKCVCRAASTAPNEHYSSAGPDGYPPWPSSTSPTPYEIFGLKPKEFNKQKVRRLFYRMAKVYHPDMVDNGKLAKEIRAERFRKINEAYEILKSDSKRRALDAKLTAMGSASRYGYPRSPNYRYTGGGAASSTYTRSGSNFYQRGEYEGYEDEAQRRQSDAAFQEQLNKSKKQILILLSLSVAAIAVLELVAVFKVTEKGKARREHESYLAEVANLRAHSNYGMGEQAEDRISRFLSMRNSSGYYDNYGIDSLSPTLSLTEQRRK